LNTQNNLTTVPNNLAAANLNTVVVNTQLVTVCHELDSVGVGDSSGMSCPMFSGKQLDDAVQLVRNFNLWRSTKNLPASAAAVANLHVDAEKNKAEISYFAATLKDSATL